ncbi:DUF11 domain-containing protein [bacterium]|nr:DUF11 domain-containing protein [bacterium]
MKSSKWFVWGLLVAVSFVGAKWMSADELPELAPPPALSPPTVKVESLSAPPKPLEMDPTISELPATNKAKSAFSDTDGVTIPDDIPTEVPASVPPRRTGNARLESPSANMIQPTSAFVPYEPGSPVGPSATGKAEQSISIEWIGPAETRIGKPAEYEIVVHNHGEESVRDVVVENVIPVGMRVISVEPRALQENDHQAWNVGSLEPDEERRLRLSMVADQKGTFSFQASVTAKTLHVSSFRATEPMLAVRATTTEKLMVGDTLTSMVEVSNPGDGPTEGVVLKVTFSDGLRHEKGKELTIDVGTIDAGETRNVEVVCTPTAGGKQSLQIQAMGGGDLTAEATAHAQVCEPNLDLTIAGPSLRYLDRHANYVLKVSNLGDAAAENVKVTAIIPSGFRFSGSSAGGRHDFASSSVSWVVGQLPAGETREMTYKCLASQPGEQKHTASAVASRGLKKEANVSTQVEGISALLLEVVDVDDPVEVGSETSYEIRVTNQGSREATNVEIHALVPAEMQIRGGQGPTKYRVEGQEVLFAPLPKLAPRADAIYRVLVQGSAAGDLRFRARLISDSLTEPVIEEESTKVYGD